MKKLFLSSAGLQPDYQEDFLKLLGKSPAQATVAFIATAADPEPDKTFVQWSIDQISETGMKMTAIDLKSETPGSIYDKLKNTDVIWINGGNTYYLLDQIRKSGFDQIIGRLLEEGKIYFGVSAGTVLAGLDIEAAGWKPGGDEDVIGLSDYSGLKLVDFNLTTHYRPEQAEIIREQALSAGRPIIVLNDHQAVIVNNGQWEIAGTGEKVTYGFNN